MLSALCLVTSVGDVRLHMLLFSKLGAHRSDLAPPNFL